MNGWSFAVLHRLHDQLRESDTIARLGGDEFAVVLPEASADRAVQVARKLSQALLPAFTVEQHALEVGASIGIALYPEHGADPDDLLRRADIALYVAKRSGHTFAIYTQQQDLHDLRQLALIADLREAIDHGHLTLHYQAQVSFRTGRLRGWEGLARWPHPTRGFVPPLEFIPLAEQTGLIKPLTLGMLGMGLRQCRAWGDRGLEVPIALNVSLRNLLDPDFSQNVSELLATSGITGRLLELEITESTIMSDPERILETLSRLSGQDVRFAVDDFGTGYSSLAHLQRFPVETIKVDKSFVIGMATDRSKAAIVRATIDLGHALDLEVVAEGVEDKATWDLLANLGCDAAQGYYVTRPLPPADIDSWLQESPWGAGQTAGQDGER